MRIVGVIAVLIACSNGKTPAKTSNTSSGSADESSHMGTGIPANIPCANRIALHCGEGRIDGCSGGKTLVHICMPVGETAGPPCSQEIAKQCPTGQTDACLKSPPVANTHLCVF